MTKAELKAAWGKYCDTDKLVDTMRGLLTKCQHRNSEHGVCVMLNEYFTNKRELIDTLATSPNYRGDMRIMIDIELERNLNTHEIFRFCSNFISNMRLDDFFLTKKDEHGKTIDDYGMINLRLFNAKDLFKKEINDVFATHAANVAKFDHNGYLRASTEKYSDIRDVIRDGFGRNPYSTIDSNTIYRASKMAQSVKLSEGMKTSRAFNKVCSEYGIDKAWPAHEVDRNGNMRTVYPYDKLFATYSDMVTSGKRKLKFFISVNPLDYLTMSFGVNWKSCHSIRTPHGGWCGGCVSYMLDSSSIIIYVHSDVPETIEEGKVYREMFHYKNGALLQSRVYPQENDGQLNLYNEFWKIFAAEFSPLIGVDANNWVRKEYYDPFTKSTGVHYKDYNNSRFFFRYTSEIDKADSTIIPIGHKRICPHCGVIDDDMGTSQISHNTCRI